MTIARLDSCRSVDKAQKWSGYGSSSIYDSEGRILATARSKVGDEIVYALLPVAKDSAVAQAAASAASNSAPTAKPSA